MLMLTLIIAVRARAIETGAWVIAAAQVGRHHGAGGKRVVCTNYLPLK